MTQDSRKYNRRQVSEYFIAYDQISDCRIGVVFDLSTDGMMMIAESRIEPPLILACRMALPAKVLGCDQLELSIEVMWCRQNELTGVYETGFQFIDPTAHQKKLIQVILDKWTAKEVDEEHPTFYKLDPKA